MSAIADIHGRRRRQASRRYDDNNLTLPKHGYDTNWVCLGVSGECGESTYWGARITPGLRKGSGLTRDSPKATNVSKTCRRCPQLLQHTKNPCTYLLTAIDFISGKSLIFNSM